jgi:hypothetical protein
MRNFKKSLELKKSKLENGKWQKQRVKTEYF